METSGPPPTLLEVVSSLVTAWRNLAAYPAGHPSRTSALSTAYGRLTGYLTATAAPLVFGISHDGLSSGDRKLDAAHVRTFARALYRRNGGLLRIEEDVDPRDLEGFLGLLDTPGSRARASLGDELQAAGITRITVSAIDYSALVATSDMSDSTPGQSLWDGLLQVLLVGRPVDREGGPPLPRERYSAETIASLFRTGPGSSGGTGTSWPGTGGSGPGGAGPGGAGVGPGGGGSGVGIGRGPGAGAGASGTGWGDADTGRSGTGRGGAETGGSGTGRGGAGPGGSGAGPGGAGGARTGIGAPGDDMGGRGPASVGSFEAGQASSGRLGAAAAQTLASAVGVRLSRAEGPGREVLVPQIIQLLRALPGEVREPVLAEALKVIATDDAASPQLARLAASLPPADVLRGLRRLAREQAQLSSHALHMVQTLAAADEGGAVGAAVLADPAVNFAELAELFRDEDVDRYNPEDHRVLLNQTPTVDLASVSADAAAEPDAVGVESESDDAIDRRMLATLLDLAAAFPEADNPLVFGRLREFFVRALQVRRFDQAIVIIRGVREIAEVPAEGGQRRPIADFLDRLADAQILAALVAASRQPGGPPFVQVQSIVLALGAWGARGVLGALAEEPDRVRRLRLLDLAASIGPAIVPETTRMLSDPRWFVVRNMVLLLRRVQDRTAMVQIRRCAEHPDLRVRLEAIRALFAFDTQLPRDLLARAIHHPDPRLAEAAVLLTGQHGITQAIDLLVEILLRWDPLGRKRSLRLKALRALSDLGDAAVLPRIGRFFRDWPIPIIALEERRAAYRLLSGYDEVARAPYAARGARSRDAMIREICRGLVKSTTPAPESA